MSGGEATRVLVEDKEAGARRELRSEATARGHFGPVRSAQQRARSCHEAQKLHQSHHVAEGGAY
jgi:hypothetical protein